MIETDLKCPKYGGTTIIKHGVSKSPAAKILLPKQEVQYRYIPSRLLV